MVIIINCQVCQYLLINAFNYFLLRCLVHNIFFWLTNHFEICRANVIQYLLYLKASLNRLKTRCPKREERKAFVKSQLRIY